MQFATQLKNLSAHGVTEIGPALKNAFDMLNMNRNQSGIDTYGQVGFLRRAPRRTTWLVDSVIE